MVHNHPLQSGATVVDDQFTNDIDPLWIGLTLIFALTNAALFGASPTAAYIVPQLCLSQLYFNSLLVSRTSFFYLPVQPLSKPSSFSIKVGRIGDGFTRQTINFFCCQIPPSVNEK